MGKCMLKKQVDFDMKRIAGTLKYGWFDGEKKKYIIPAFIVFSLVVVGFSMGFGLTMVILNIQEHGGVNGFADILALVGCFFASFALPLVLGLLIYRNEKYRKEIELWLSDAVELTAYVREIGVIQSEFISANNLYKIQVEFEYNGQHYKIESRGKQLSGTKSSYGFHNVWKDYINRKVNIMYSPEYNEVIVLKD